MYKIIVKGKEFTIPKLNLIALAQVKALYCGLHNYPKTEAEAVEFFISNGIEIKEV